MIRITALFLGTILLSLTAFAQVPAELRNLIPAGSTSVRLDGVTKDQRKCRVAISAQGDIFSADVYGLTASNQLDSKHFAKFQIGFGHELQSLQETDEMLTAISKHEAEEAYSSDTRSTLKIQFANEVISAVQVVEEAKGWFSYHTEAKETCLLQ